MSRLPNFFIAGAPKAGTTSLYHYLDQHPQIYMSAIKEPHYFAAEIREENLDDQLRRLVSAEAPDLRAFLDGPMIGKRFGGTVTDWNDYIRLFQNAPQQTILGEASVCYLWSESAPGAIAERIPDAKVIVMLRDPVERAFAQYLHGVANGAIRWSFRQHIESGMRHTTGPLCVYRPFLEFGMYAEQVRRYRTVFGTRLWIGFYEDFRDYPGNTFQEICRFLDVDAGFAPDMAQRYLECTGWRSKVRLWRAGAFRMETRDASYLRDYYRDDVRTLADFTGRDLSTWLR